LGLERSRTAQGLGRGRLLALPWLGQEGGERDGWEEIRAVHGGAGMSLPKINVVPRTGGVDSQKPQKPNAQPFAQLEEKLQKQLDKALYAGGSPAAQRIRNFL